MLERRLPWMDKCVQDKVQVRRPSSGLGELLDDTVTRRKGGKQPYFVWGEV